ncbi:glycerophosphodiester phosphodiesterase [Cellulomonas edaphi]|uniref:Glycerophosphodiester phosphodiesterase n=1 Tax=Cellulomonas edaphi TaxID=3053468 RepID=A0ABT7S3A0_9CELL|nr:glycerophosphodiester phosphodiesterase [Cellulomons edaphi]MDM7830099.1 glycerophosphodiester phosphodiesterase [Cellulomons edaphi]
MTDTALPARPVVVGHRGRGRSFAPLRPPAHALVENTRASFVAAHEAGAQWVELDVVASQDGVPFLWHNHYAGGRPVHTVPARELDELGIERFADLSADLPPGLGVDVEIKPLPVTAGPGRHGERVILEQVLAMAQTRPVLWSSFDPAIAATGRDAGLRSAWITRQKYPLHEAVMAAANLRVDAVVVHGLTTLEAGDARDLAWGWQVAARSGVRVWCWDVSIGRIGELAGAGVTGFCTDEVPEAAAVLRALEGGG